MKYVLLLILFVPLWLSAQPDTLMGEEVIFIDPEIHPEFPGGNAALKKFIADNVVYPPAHICSMGMAVKVYVRFRISPQGRISDITLQKSTSEDEWYATEAMRIIQLMPDWIPGSIHGNPVESWYMLPIKFDL